MGLSRRARSRGPGRALSLALLAAGIGATAGCPRGSAAPGAATQAQARPPLAVSVEPVRREVIQRSIAVFGTLHGDEEATISNKVAGRVQHVAADVGDVVSSGAPLCELELEDFQLSLNAARRALDAALARLSVDHVPDDRFDVDGVATVERAKAQLENSKARLARLTNLDQKGQGFVAEQTIKDAETEVMVGRANLDAERLAMHALVAEARQRQAEVALQERRLADGRVRAPGGTRRWAVSSRLVSEGEYAKEGTALFRLVASDPLKLKAAVPERYVADLKVGQEASVRVEAYGQRAFPGRVSRINPSVDVTNRTFGIEVLVANHEGALLPGTFAKAEVLTRKEEALLVPLESVVSFAGVTKVFVLDKDRVRERVVSQGDRAGRLVEAKGVEPDAQVLVRGQTAVADGSPVVLAPADGAAKGEASR